MSSTSTDGSLNEVEKFFFEELMPLAKKLRESGNSFFALKPDPNAQSYYTKREKTTMEHADFELAGCDSVDNFQGALVDMWRSLGNPELVVLAPTLSKLAKSLYSVEEQSEEVSPFIYVMF